MAEYILISDRIYLGISPAINIADFKPDEIARKLMDAVSTQCIIINIEARTKEQKYRQHHTALDTLYFLRCVYGKVNPVVCVGYEPLDEILKRKPENIILCSPGTQYVQNPVSQSDFYSLSFSSLQLEEKANLKKYLRGVFSIDRFRHDAANWWGIMSLWDMHKLITEEKFKESHPQKVVKAYTTYVNNALAKFCFEVETESLKGLIQEQKKQREEEKNKCLQEIEKETEEIKALTPDLIVSEEQKNVLQSQILDLQSTCLQIAGGASKELLSQIREIQADLSIWEQDFKNLCVRKSELETHQQSEQQKVNQLNQQLNHLHADVKKIFFNHVADYDSIRQKLSTKSHPPKILHIDDQAEDGWAKIFQEIVYGKIDKENFKAPNFSSTIDTDKIESAIETIYKQIENYLAATGTNPNANNFNPDLILLDVRIFPDYDKLKRHDVRKMSGPLLLNRIRKDHPSIPVLITTASNKVWTYQQIMSSGADAFWTKEGLDEQRTAEESINNYVQFLDTIEKLSCEKYQTLKWLGNEIKKLKDNNSLWWKKEIDWSSLGGCKHNMEQFNVPVRNTPDSQKIISILDDCFILFREYLQREILEHTYNSFKGRDWVLPSLIMQHAGKIVEIVHSTDEYESVGIRNIFVWCRGNGLIRDFELGNELRSIFFNGRTISKLYYKDDSTVKRVPIRYDRKGGEIFSIRNKGSHLSGLDRMTYTNLEGFLKKLVSYLSTPPNHYAAFFEINLH